MTLDPVEVLAALARGSRRATVHLLKAGAETLRAVSAVIEELEQAGRGDGGPEQRGPERIEVE